VDGVPLQHLKGQGIRGDFHAPATSATTLLLGFSLGFEVLGVGGNDCGCSSTITHLVSGDGEDKLE
jgi:hypothetical protein